MTTVNIAIEDYNIFVANTLNEGAQLYRSRDALGLESFSTTSYASISNEGFIDWVKDKLRKIGQRFVIVVNKVIARFSKNRAALEANIAKYKENPQAEVELAVSPKTLKRIAMTIGVVAAAIVAMFMCIPNKDGKSRIAQIFSKTKNTVAETKAEVKKDEAQGPHVVKAAEAGTVTVAIVKADEKTESTLNAAKGKIASAGSGGDEGTIKEKLGNVARATSNTFELAKEAAALRKAEFIKIHGDGATKSHSWKRWRNSEIPKASDSDKQTIRNRWDSDGDKGVLQTKSEVFAKYSNVPARKKELIRRAESGAALLAKIANQPDIKIPAGVKETGAIKAAKEKVRNAYHKACSARISELKTLKAEVEKTDDNLDLNTLNAKIGRAVHGVEEDTSEARNALKALVQSKDKSNSDGSDKKKYVNENKDVGLPDADRSPAANAKAVRMLMGHITPSEAKLRLSDDESKVPAIVKAHAAAVKAVNALVTKYKGLIDKQRTKAGATTGDASNKAYQAAVGLVGDFRRDIKGVENTMNKVIKRVKKS